ncbi:response regulator transcription factor [Risungbinella massiliensis]|uniref:response regulator transcription factor n=1 Tax=Risungbinella massiliensis TaxID=1329796 RepID=UPI0005CC2D61|nr:response regulator transcription factor [Risungbinella massiliensis]
MQPSILLVDDDPEIREVMTDFFLVENFHVHSASNTIEARQLLANSIDILLLDIMMPGQDGFSFCKELRNKDPFLPIIFWSARETDFDKIRGLSLGADDYIVKSVSPFEIIARVKSVLRRSQLIQMTNLQERQLCPGLIVHPSARQVLLRGEEVALTQKEYDLLLFLSEHPQQVFTYEQLYRHVWQEEFGDIHTVKVHMGRIREKVEHKIKAKLFQTVWGVGYKYIGEVVR